MDLSSSFRQSDSAARTLSFLGLIPFAVSALACWVPDPAVQAMGQLSLAAYGAVILTFIGAIHWGRVLAAPTADPLSSLWMLWAVTPSLIGWVALMLPAVATLPALALGFLMAWVADRKAVESRLMPPWYGQMRTLLTSMVLLSLGVGWFAL